MTEPITLPTPFMELTAPLHGKSEREHEAFRRLLPQLLVMHRGRYVAIHEGEVVDTGDNKLVLAMRVLAKVGNVAIHVGLVKEDPERVARSGVRREVRSCGGAP